MPSLQIRDVDPLLIQRLKAVAKREHRSLGNQVLFILERFLEQDHPAYPTLPKAAERLEDYWNGAAVEPPELRIPHREGPSDRDDTVRRALKRKD